MMTMIGKFSELSKPRYFKSQKKRLVASVYYPIYADGIEGY